MIIGINLLFSAQGGSLRNLRQLLVEWARSGALREHAIVLYCSARTHDAIRDLMTDGMTSRIIDKADRGLLWRTAMEQVALPRMLKRDHVEVLFSPGNTMPVFSSVPCVTTFQNAAPFCASVTRKSVGLTNWIRLYVVGIFMRLAARRSARVIFLSHYFRDLFVDRFRFPVRKGVVIYRARDGFC